LVNKEKPLRDAVDAVLQKIREEIRSYNQSAISRGQVIDLTDDTGFDVIIGKKNKTMSNSSSSSSSGAACDSSSTSEGDEELTRLQEKLNDIIFTSGLMEVMDVQLRNESFVDMERRSELYYLLFQALLMMTIDTLRPLLIRPLAQGNSDAGKEQQGDGGSSNSSSSNTGNGDKSAEKDSRGDASSAATAPTRVNCKTLAELSGELEVLSSVYLL
jgi:hypothetical protein